MSILLLAIGWAMLSLPGLADKGGRTLVPRTWATATRSLMLGGLASVEAALLLTGGPAVLHAFDLDRLAALCSRIAGHLVTAQPAVSWTAVVLAVGIAVGGAHSVATVYKDRRSGRAESSLGHHEDLGGLELVIFDREPPTAHAVPGDPRQVVVSRGLVTSLDTRAAVMVVLHEVAHLERGHDRRLAEMALIRGAVGRLPGVARSLASWQLALEREADEEAASSTEDRIALRRALLAASLSPAEAQVLLQPSFGLPEHIVVRFAALAHPPPSHRPLMGLAVQSIGVGLSALAGVVAVLWLGDVHVNLLVVTLCPL